MLPDERQRILQTLGEIRDATQPVLLRALTEAELVQLRTRLQDTMRTLKDAGRVTEDVPDMSSFTRSQVYLGARGLMRVLEPSGGVGGRRRKTRKPRKPRKTRKTRKARR